MGIFSLISDAFNWHRDYQKKETKEMGRGKRNRNKFNNKRKLGSSNTAIASTPTTYSLFFNRVETNEIKDLFYIEDLNRNFIGFIKLKNIDLLLTKEQLTNLNRSKYYRLMFPKEIYNNILNLTDGTNKNIIEQIIK